LSLTLREVNKLRVLEFRVLRKIRVPRRDEIIGGWRKLHNTELHNVNTSPDTTQIMKSRTMKLEGHLARIWKKRNEYMALD
jgi:hypothetical protein